MDKDNILKVNQKIQVEVKNGAYKGKYPSRIEDVSDLFITIAAPVHQGALVPLNPGMTVTIFITMENSVYSFNSLITEKKLQPIPMLILSKPENINKIQRRSFFRLKTNLPVLCRTVPSLTSPSFDEFGKFFCRDISGGGLLLVMEEPPPMDTFLEILLDLPKFGSVSAIARIVLIRDAQDKKAKEVATEFVIIEEKDREKIVKFIFDQQREQRKKEIFGKL